MVRVSPLVSCFHSTHTELGCTATGDLCVCICRARERIQILDLPDQLLHKNLRKLSYHLLVRTRCGESYWASRLCLPCGVRLGEQAGAVGACRVCCSAVPVRSIAVNELSLASMLLHGQSERNRLILCSTNFASRAEYFLQRCADRYLRWCLEKNRRWAAADKRAVCKQVLEKASFRKMLHLIFRQKMLSMLTL